MSNQNTARVELPTDGLSLPRLIVSQEAVIHTRRPECWRSLPEIDAALIDFLCNRGVSGELSPEQTIARLLEYLRAPGRLERLLKAASENRRASAPCLAVNRVHRVLTVPAAGGRLIGSRAGAGRIYAHPLTGTALAGRGVVPFSFAVSNV